MNNAYANLGKHVLLVGLGSNRASELGALIERAGSRWSFQDFDPTVQFTIPVADYDVVVIPEDLIESTGGHATLTDSELGAHRAVFVGLVRGGYSHSLSLFGSNVDLILYEPLVIADIERMLAFANAIHSETPEQSRNRLRRMTALHEIAIASGTSTGTVGWLDRLIDAGRQILEPNALAMWGLDPEGKRIRCVGSSGLEESYIRAAEERSEEVVQDYEALLRQLSTDWLTVGDTTDTFRLIVPEAAQATGIQRIAWLPVRDSHRVYGHLSFYFTTTDSHLKHDLVLADAFASIVAAALATFWLQTEIRRSNRLYREHVETSLDGVVVCHSDGTIERTNPAIGEITGRNRYEVLGQQIFDWFSSPDELHWDEWSVARTDIPDETVELWLSRESGERRRVSCYGRHVRFPDPRTPDVTEDRVQIVIQDITDQARRLVELELFHDLTRLISNRGSLEEAFELVVSRLFNYLNYRLVAIGEVSNQRLLHLRAYRSLSPDLYVPPISDANTGLCGRAVRENQSVLERDVSQSPEYVSIDDDVVSEIVAVIRANGQPIGLINIQTDKTQPLNEGDLQLAESIAAHLGLLIEQVTLHERLERQALTDPLTGMANRRAFMQHLEALMADSDAGQAGLMLVELDRFKSVNDRFGHLFGDEMLKQVARRLKAALGEHDVLARYGGDEIAMIFHNVSPKRAFAIAEQLRDSVSRQPFSFNGSTVDLTVSVGIALYPLHGTTPDHLIAEADRAMYAAKLGGRNRISGDVAGAN